MAIRLHRNPESFSHAWLLANCVSLFLTRLIIKLHPRESGAWQLDATKMALGSGTACKTNVGARRTVRNWGRSGFPYPPSRSKEFFLDLGISLELVLAQPKAPVFAWDLIFSLHGAGHPKTVGS